MRIIDSAEFRGRTVVGFMTSEIFDRFDWLIDTYQVTTVLELGAFVGLSTCYLAERVDRVITVDNFDVRSHDYPSYLRDVHRPAAENQYAEFLRNTLPYPNITGIRMDFFEAATLPIEVDMVYIDAAQPYEKFKQLVELYLPKARKVIAGDDSQATGVAQTLREMGVPITERTWWKPI